jgi:endonuclease/exonuclease/phosphatase family metal-dependent hydrolase
VVASYNVHRCVGLDGRRDPGRVAAVIGELAADVVGLQEVDSSADPSPRSSQLDALARATGYRSVAGPILTREDGHTGNGLLTRLPIREERRIDLSVDGREPRGALDVLLEHRGATIRVAVTHLGLRGHERRAQGHRLLDLLARRGEDLSILIGDFNEWLATSRVLRRLHASFGRGHGVRTFPSPCPLLALDRVWVRPVEALHELRAHRSRLARRASDHLPVRAVVALSGRSGPPTRLGREAIVS